MKKLIFMTLVAVMVVFAMTGCKKSYTIIVKSNIDEWGTVTGSGIYKEGETVTISAVPADGYYFISWNDGDKSNPRQIVVSGNAEYIATFSDNEIIHNAVTDIDGNYYDAVKIGDQVWMAQNLRTTHYADGTAIPYYVNPDLDASVYGYYYNWPAAIHGAASSNTVPSGVQGVCPNGWHLPSDAEWTQLTAYVGSQPEYTCDGSSNNIAKALASTEGWNSSTNSCSPGSDPNTNNTSGFGAVPAGCYGSMYDNAGDHACFWSSTEWEDWSIVTNSPLAKGYSLWLCDPDVTVYFNSTNSGYPVRCLRE